MDDGAVHGGVDASLLNTPPPPRSGRSIAMQENIALNDRLNTFFTSINNIGSMRGAVQFPTLQVGGGGGVVQLLAVTLFSDMDPSTLPPVTCLHGVLQGSRSLQLTKPPPSPLSSRRPCQPTS